jgi:branched-chain amino acid transport system substrate-binding protein
MRTPKLLAGLALASLTLAACGSNGNQSASGSSGTCSGTIKIGVDLPLSGTEASDGQPTLNGVQFAVSHVWGGKVDGCTLTVDAKDDTVSGVHNPSQGAQNVSGFVSDSSVLGMVGPFNSSVAQAEIPIANAGHLTMISPANTNPCLTKDLSTCAFHPADLRKSAPSQNNYFRVAATDDFQGPAMADYAYDKLNIHTVAVGSDNETYGKGIADAFANEFQNVKHGTVVDHENFDYASTASFAPWLNRAKADGAQGIYYGGTDGTKGCIPRAQMAGIFPASVPEMGGDGLVSTECPHEAGGNVVGMYATVATADATQLSTASAAIAAFKQAYSDPNAFGAYTMPAYDAANILITGIKKAIEAKGGGMPTREQVRAQVAQTKNFQGVLGNTSFDANGDTSNKIITVYYSNGCCNSSNWAFKASVNYGSGG